MTIEMSVVVVVVVMIVVTARGLRKEPRESRSLERVEYARARTSVFEEGRGGPSRSSLAYHSHGSTPAIIVPVCAAARASRRPYSFLHARACEREHIYTHIHTHSQTHTHTRRASHTCVCVYVCVCASSSAKDRVTRSSAEVHCGAENALIASKIPTLAPNAMALPSLSLFRFSSSRLMSLNRHGGAQSAHFRGHHTTTRATRPRVSSVELCDASCARTRAVAAAAAASPMLHRCSAERAKLRCCPPRVEYDSPTFLSRAHRLRRRTLTVSRRKR